jgi:hypothetical protein
MTTTLTRYVVYHALDPMQLVFFDAAQWVAHRDTHYRRVAEVNISSEESPLQRVFRLTNHLDEAWIRNSEVAWFATDAPVRSTSVGDVVVCEQTEQAWMVIPYGFELVACGETEHRREPPPD